MHSWVFLEPTESSSGQLGWNATRLIEGFSNYARWANFISHKTEISHLEPCVKQMLGTDTQGHRGKKNAMLFQTRISLL